jgi:hypothetical protein
LTPRVRWGQGHQQPLQQPLQHQHKTRQYKTTMTQRQSYTLCPRRCCSLLVVAALLISLTGLVDAFALSPLLQSTRHHHTSRHSHQLQRPSHHKTRRTSPLQASTSPATESTAVYNSTDATSSSVKSATTALAYPTRRGDSVDARQIVRQGSAYQHLQALSVNHVLFLSQALALEAMHQVSGGLDFSHLAPVD